MNAPKPDGPGKLIGGYATNNLSEKEKDQLFQAALEDQDLFNSLMEDESLRHLLEQPGVRKELVTALTRPPNPWQRFVKWIGTPVALGSMGAVATAAILLVVLTNNSSRKEATMEMAKSAPPPTAGAQQPALPDPTANPISIRTSRDASAAEERTKRKRVNIPANEPLAATPLATPVTDPGPSRADASKSKGELKDALRKELDTAQSAQAQSAPSQAQGTLAAPQAQQMAAPPPPPPAPVVANSRAPAANTVLAFDYSVTADGVQMLPATDGFAALIARNPAGTYVRVVASTRARKGFTSTLPFPAGPGGDTYQLVLTRDSTMPSIGGPAPEEQVSSNFRGLAPRMARQAAAVTPGGQTGGRAADKKDSGATQSGHVAAESPAAPRVAVEIVAPRR